MMSSYSDVIVILCYAPHCDDIAMRTLDRLALIAAGERLSAHDVALSCGGGAS